MAVTGLSGGSAVASFPSDGVGESVRTERSVNTTPVPCVCSPSDVKTDCRSSSPGEKICDDGRLTLPFEKRRFRPEEPAALPLGCSTIGEASELDEGRAVCGREGKAGGFRAGIGRDGSIDREVWWNERCLRGALSPTSSAGVNGLDGLDVDEKLETRFEND